jgi:hypothetical protein
MHRWLAYALCKISRPATVAARVPPKAKLRGGKSFWQQLCPPILLPSGSNNMEVTREDFEKNDSQLLKDIVQTIKEAQFGTANSSLMTTPSSLLSIRSGPRPGIQWRPEKGE